MTMLQLSWKEVKRFHNAAWKLKKPVIIPVDQKRNLRLVRSKWSSEMRYHAVKTKTADARLFMKSVTDLLDWIVSNDHGTKNRKKTGQ